MKPLLELIINAQSLIQEISQHPDYKTLLQKGYSPDLNIADASTALIYLSFEVDPQRSLCSEAVLTMLTELGSGNE